MNLYRVVWHDPHQGTCYEWHATKGSAHRSRVAMHADNPEIDHSVDRVVVKDGKLGLVDWLNRNFDRDNG